MKIPKGKGFDLACGLLITVVLEDVVLIGTFLGDFGNERSVKCPPVHVDLKCDNDPDFFLLQLTCNVLVDSREFDAGTIVAINSNEVQFIAIGGECDSECDSKCDSECDSECDF
ncbi:hypothetical protein Ga0466249_004974 [Sporomusaceae bacterium BoRhaA]|uniref:hypothetical protein n=1 Tax=Pelorhabdus rhamnosifermentans TaxID=2772457 RepID=UPI001C064643|nr:hypothetical protein [Pelorhabdus rhamnosifermentans]MBU2703824.1 hypothetical protein [Pelorhabdus rhamnosifermentans]